jgi:sialic acid synthase SpsE
MRVGRFDTDARVLIVAEIGNNHEGSFAAAKELVRAAHESGVDAVKFQTFRARYLQSATDPARFARLESFELEYEEYADLAELARSLGLLFLTTPFDLESARRTEPLVDAFKVASGDNDFFPLIEQLCRSGKPLVVSAGMADLELIRRTRDFIENCWQRFDVKQELALLHCVTAYPTPPAEANLAAIRTLGDELGCTVGYSDHTLGVEACVLAVAAGARILEKHFTLDKSRSGFRDHQLSADPREMRELVTRVREAEALVGRAEKALQPSEEAARVAARRSIVAAADLAAGHRVTPADLTWIRPATGLPPGQEHRLVGRVVRRAVPFGQPLRPEDVE